MPLLFFCCSSFLAAYWISYWLLKRNVRLSKSVLLVCIYLWDNYSACWLFPLYQHFIHFWPLWRIFPWLIVLTYIGLHWSNLSCIIHARSSGPCSALVYSLKGAPYHVMSTICCSQGCRGSYWKMPPHLHGDRADTLHTVGQSSLHKSYVSILICVF